MRRESRDITELELRLIARRMFDALLTRHDISMVIGFAGSEYFRTNNKRFKVIADELRRLSKKHKQKNGEEEKRKH